MPTSLRIIPRDRHNVSRKHINKNALSVLYRLKNAGYEAYLVGGGVRDLLLGNFPKDFDVATDAHPEEIKSLFKNCRLIGRRFRLAHILFGRDIIEVATFRAAPEGSNHSQHQQSETGQLIRDNVYGTLEEDAARRDFTINALYYSVDDFAIREFANGLDDLHAKQIQLIGNPESRYREDPVRMLRAIRFAAKLNFNIAPEAASPIFKLGDLLDHIPGARLFDESQKIFASGSAKASWHLLVYYNIVTHLFPALSEDDNPVRDALIEQAMTNTDERILSGKHISPSFLFAVILWHPVQLEMLRLREQGVPPALAMQTAAQLIIEKQIHTISIPRRFIIAMREMWDLQLKLPRRQGKRAERLVSHPRFRAAYDFLLLREESGEISPGLGLWWTEYQEASEAERKKMLKELSSEKKNGKKRQHSSRKNRKKPSAQ